MIAKEIIKNCNYLYYNDSSMFDCLCLIFINVEQCNKRYCNKTY